MGQNYRLTVFACVTFLHAVGGSYSPCGVQKQLHFQ